MLKHSMRYYKKFCKGIESIRFEVNPYYVCVANHIIDNKITRDVIDGKSIHEDSKVKDEFWIG